MPTQHLTRDRRGLFSVCALLMLSLVLASCGGNGSNEGSGPSQPVPPASGVARPKGYFALTTRTLSDSKKQELVSQPFVSGMTSYVTWADIEPLQGQYDFSRLDADIAIARAAGKKITLGVFTGRDALPSWLAAQGVRLWTNSQGGALIHPNDTAFVNLWVARVAKLGERYDQDPTVVQVTICGAAGTLCGPRYPELPPDADYQQLKTNWLNVINAYASAFPNTQLNLEVHLTVGHGVDLPVDLFAALPSSLNIGPFAEFLSDTAPTTTSVIGSAYHKIALTRGFCGFQTVSALGALLPAAVELGRTHGCSYFELYADDVSTVAAQLPGL